MKEKGRDASLVRAFSEKEIVPEGVNDPAKEGQGGQRSKNVLGIGPTFSQRPCKEVRQA